MPRIVTSTSCRNGGRGARYQVGQEFPLKVISHSAQEECPRVSSTHITMLHQLPILHVE